MARVEAALGRLLEDGTFEPWTGEVNDAEAQALIQAVVNWLDTNAARDRTEFPLPPAQVTDLKTVLAEISNLPAEYPLPQSQVDALTAVSGGGGTSDTVSIVSGVRITRFDYADRTDGNPVYIGSAPAGSLDTDVGWTIQRFTYDTSARPVAIETFTGAWAVRETLT